MLSQKILYPFVRPYVRPYVRPAESSSKHSSPSGQFHKLDIDVGILKHQVADIKLGIRDLDHKVEDVRKTVDNRFYTIMAMIVGSVFVKGGFDFWHDEHKGSTH